MPIGIYKHKSNQGFQKGNKFGLSGKKFKTGHIPWNKNKNGYHIHTEQWKDILKTKKYTFNKHWKIKDSSGMNKDKIGKKRPDVSIRLKGKFGKNHQAWKGGCKKNERNDSAYHQWVRKVKARDKQTCWLNDKDCKGFNIVHHIFGWTKYPKLRYKLNNGITLCQAHHKRVHRTRAIAELFRKMFSYLIKQK